MNLAHINTPWYASTPQSSAASTFRGMKTVGEVPINISVASNQVTNGINRGNKKAVGAPTPTASILTFSPAREAGQTGHLTSGRKSPVVRFVNPSPIEAEGA